MVDAHAIMNQVAKEQQVDPKILNAIITIESSWNPDAIRYEPFFPYVLEPETYSKAYRISAETEKRLQMFSYGLVQIMGGTARGLGYMGSLLRLIDIPTNILFGCKVIKRIQAKYSDPMDIAAAYNAGSARKDSEGNYVNKPYVDKFASIYSQLSP